MKTTSSSKRQLPSFLSFPRFRRLRQSESLREMFAEVRLHPSNFILPIFVRRGISIRQEISSMPGVYQLSPEQVVKDLKVAESLGLKAFILFGVIDSSVKDEIGSAALDPKNIICQTLKLVKKSGIGMTSITDLCFCEYTSHGHCGVLTSGSDQIQTVDNDLTLERLARQALNHAKAGADIIAPSGMMDGMVAAVRKALDDHEYEHLPILSYAVKYASAFYGPFRDAAESAPAFGDRRSYQMDFCRRDEALREARADLEQGADILMVKPGLPYLDILRELKRSFDAPLAAFHVSGEYSMIKAAAQKGWIDEKTIVLESLTALKRAGANLILTYYAQDAARWLQK